MHSMDYLHYTVAAAASFNTCRFIWHCILCCTFYNVRQFYVLNHRSQRPPEWNEKQTKNINRFYASHSKYNYRILASAPICNSQYSLSVQAVYNGKTVNVNDFVNHRISLINCKNQFFLCVSGVRLHHDEENIFFSVEINEEASILWFLLKVKQLSDNLKSFCETFLGCFYILNDFCILCVLKR